MRRVALACLALGATGALWPPLASAAPADAEYWIAQQDTDKVAIVSGTRVQERLPLPAGAGPHSIDVSPSGAFAYVAGVGNGDLYVFDVAARRLVETLDLGGKGTHQAQPTPDGRRVLVAQMESKQVVVVDADEKARRWTKGQTLTLEKEPICTVFDSGGRRAFVSMKPDGLAVVDTSTMTLEKELATAGAVQCGLAESPDPDVVYVSSNGGSGHLYRLNTRTAELEDTARQLNGKDIHGLALDAAGTTAYLTAREDDTLKVLALTGSDGRTVSLDRRPGEPDKPDQVRVAGDTVVVAMRTAGDIALIDRRTMAVRYLSITSPSANAVHGVAVTSTGSPPATASGQLPRTGFATSWLAVLVIAAVAGAHWHSRNARATRQP